MVEIKFYKSRNKGIKLLIVSIAFAGIGIWMITDKAKTAFDQNMGWFMASFFGLGAMLGIFVVFDRRPQIIISESGIFDRTLKQGIIPWHDLTEVYPIFINDQKFLSVVTTEAFVLKKKPNRLTATIGEMFGVQQLNLNLAQITVDEKELALLINKLIVSTEIERRNQIRTFASNRKLGSDSETPTYLGYAIVLLFFVSLSLSGQTGFMSVMIATGVSAVIARWCRGTSDASKFYRYAKVITYLGFMNMVLLLLFFKTFDAVADGVGNKVNHGIVQYESEFKEYPDDIKNLRKSFDLSLIENCMAERMTYRKNGQTYILMLEMPNGNIREFNQNLKEWE